MQLWGSLNITCHCLSLGLELNFSSPVATVEFSKFAGILSAALSQHHLLRFEMMSLRPNNWEVVEIGLKTFNLATQSVLLISVLYC